MVEYIVVSASARHCLTDGIDDAADLVVLGFHGIVFFFGLDWRKW